MIDVGPAKEPDLKPQPEQLSQFGWSKLGGARGEVDVTRTIERSKTLVCTCTRCKKEISFNVPVNLLKLECDKCHSIVDPVQWSGLLVTSSDDATKSPIMGDGTSPVNHNLMQRLISTCYRHPAFARSIVEAYRRNYDHGKVQEWGIDKSVLLVHAANAIVQKYNSVWLPVLVLIVGGAVTVFTPKPFDSVLAVLSVFVALFLASGNMRNQKYWDANCKPTSYNPASVPNENVDGIREILKFCQGDEPRNLFFFSGYDPFRLLGLDDQSWSLVINRRKRPNGQLDSTPAELDIDTSYQRILRMVIKATTYDKSSPQSEPLANSRLLDESRFRVDDVAIVSGAHLDENDRRFVDASGCPQSELSIAELTKLSQAPDSRWRIYKRMCYYDGALDVGLLSYLRISHEGPFTYIESIGTRLLPVVEKLMGAYSAEPTADELMAQHRGPDWIREMSVELRRRIVYIGMGTIVFGLLFAFGGSLISSIVGSDPSFDSTGDINPTYFVLGVWLLPLIMVLGKRVKKLELEDDWEPRHPSLGWVIANIGLAIFGRYPPEDQRKERRKRVELAKETKEWNYGPFQGAVRTAQSRHYATNRFEHSDLTLLRHSQNHIVQEEFLSCLEDAGIDTAEFREGISRLNNFGIINQGQISGGATVENQNPQHQNKQVQRHKPMRAEKQRPSAAGVAS